MLFEFFYHKKTTRSGSIPFLTRPKALRLTVQSAFALFHVFLVWQLARHVAWAMGKTETYTQAPGAVDGWLPIVSLMTLKRWALTGQWDPVHPASLTIFLALLVMCALFRRGFCGWICPLGGISNGLDRLGRALGLSFPVSGPWRRILGFPKYLLLAGSLLGFFVLLSLPAIEAFRSGSHYVAAQARMLFFFSHPSTTLVLILTGLIVASVLIRNFWCRFLCPYGALLGLVSLLSPVAVHRNADRCISCGKCAQTCPNGIRVDQQQRVNTTQCLGCGECVAACPAPDCLSLRAGSRRVPLWLVGAGAVAVLLGFYAWARATGHWDADLPREMVQRLTRMALTTEP